MWKSPTCGCCGKWLKQLRAGFRVVVHETDDLAPVKRARGVPHNLQSCHTAEVAGYTVEGHVPAAEVKRLLAERPARGMPSRACQLHRLAWNGARREAYDVVLFDDQRRQSVWRRY